MQSSLVLFFCGCYRGVSRIYFSMHISAKVKTVQHFPFDFYYCTS